jgi:MFS family permease
MKRRIPDLLLFGAAIFQSIQFAIAGFVYFGWPGILTGLFGGAIINFCISLAASRISDIAQKRRPLAYAGMIALMTLSPACVAPGLFWTVSRAIGGWMAVMVSIVWAIAPDVAIMTSGAIAGRGLIRLEEAHPVEHAPAMPKKKAHKISTCPICKETFESPAKYAAHIRWQHPKPAIIGDERV